MGLCPEDHLYTIMGMALIKCPECGKEVSTSAAACPHCGYPMQKATGVQSVAKKARHLAPEGPQELEWVTKWKGKVNAVRLTWALILCGFLLALLTSLLFLGFDKEVVQQSGRTIEQFKFSHIVVTVVFGVLSFVAFINLLISFFIRVRIRTIEGYAVLVYVGVFKAFLVVEGQVQDSSINNRFLYGELPNKKQVWASISIWDGSVKIGVGSEGDERHVI